MTHNTTVPKRTLSTFHDMMCETEIAIDELQLLPTTARAGGRWWLASFRPTRAGRLERSTTIRSTWVKQMTERKQFMPKEKQTSPRVRR
jgi:hypothetical protein